jgi:rod shape-determining protein MreD
LISLALLQSVLLSQIDVLGAQPELLLLVVLIWAVVRNADEGVMWGFAGGLILDLLSGGPLGGTSLALVAAAFLAGQPWGQGLGSPVLRLLLLALASTAIYHLILLITLSWTGHAVDWGFALLRIAGPSILFNTVLAPFLRQPLIWLERKTRRETLTL